MDRGWVLITGASTGIGRACAEHLAARGFGVLGGVRNAEDGERLRSSAGDRVRPLLLDVTDPGQVAAAAARASEVAGEGGLRGLVNNAGISVQGPLEAVPLEDLRRQLEVNVVGQVAVTQALLPLLRRSGGRILFMSSIGGRMAVPFLAPYNASKFAIEAIADALRLELRPQGVQVVLVEPGSIATPIWEKGEARADADVDAMTPELRALYEPSLQAVRRLARATAARGLPPIAVAATVEEALTARRPATRYLVGRDARARAALRRLLPDRAVDTLVARVLGLPRRGLP